MGLIRRQLAFVPVNPATTFDPNSEATWQMKSSNLVLAGDPGTLVNPFLLLPSGDEVSLDVDRFISYGRLRTGISPTESPVWSDARTWQFPEILDGAFTYYGSIAIDTDNVMRAFAIAERVGSPPADATAFLRFYEFVPETAAPDPQVQVNIDNVRSFFRDDSVSDASILNSIAMANAMAEPIVATGIVPENTLNVILINLACYFLSSQTPLASNDKIGDEGASYIVENSMNPYWKNALKLDPTGILTQSEKEPAIIRANIRKTYEYDYEYGRRSGYGYGY